MHRILSRHRRWAVVAGLAALSLTLASCGGSSGATHAATPGPGFTPGSVTQQYSGTTINVLVPSWAALPKSSVAQFTDKTGIKVTQQTLDFDAVHDKIVTAGAAGQSPADVTEVDWTWASQFATAKWYTDLSSYLSAESISSDAGSSLFAVKGQQVAIPYNLDFRGTVVNMTMLKKAGISKPPATWDDLVTAATAIKASGGPQYPVALPLSVTEGSATPWYVLTKAAGGEILDENAAPAFTGSGSAGEQAAAFIKKLWDLKLVDPGSTNLKDQDISNNFITGKAAIVLSGSPGQLGTAKNDDTSTIRNDDVTLIATPGPAGPAQHLVGLQEGLGIPAKSEHREAAAMFVSWWQQQAQQVTSYTTPAMGNIPSQSSALTALADSKKLVGADGILALSKDVGPAFPGGVPTWYPQFSSDVASMLQNVVNGKEEPPAAMTQLGKQAKALASGS